MNNIKLDSSFNNSEVVSIVNPESKCGEPCLLKYFILEKNQCYPNAWFLQYEILTIESGERLGYATVKIDHDDYPEDYSENEDYIKKYQESKLCQTKVEVLDEDLDFESDVQYFNQMIILNLYNENHSYTGIGKCLLRKIIQQSFQLGCDGRVKLTTAYNSSAFYQWTAGFKFQDPLINQLFLRIVDIKLREGVPLKDIVFSESNRVFSKGHVMYLCSKVRAYWDKEFGGKSLIL